jgi:hypothetical protein
MGLSETSETSATSGASTLPDYYSAEQTAGRIVQFALSFYDGGDHAEYAAMVMDAVMAGYEQAKEYMGGALPSVSGDTISLVMQAVREFAATGSVDITG